MSAPARVEIFFDVVCPYAYLASTQIEAVARKAGAHLEWKPFLLGGVFRAIGQPDDLNASMPEAKRKHNLQDMLRWAAWWKVPLRMPVAHPRRTVLALRAIVASGVDPRAIHALFRAYWADGLDVAEPAVVREVLDAAGVDGSAAVEAAGTAAIKDELRARTDEAVRRGVFGAPAMFVHGEMFWGQDRLHFVERALARV